MAAAAAALFVAAAAPAAVAAVAAECEAICENVLAQLEATLLGV